MKSDFLKVMPEPVPAATGDKVVSKFRPEKNIKISGLAALIIFAAATMLVYHVGQL